VDLRAGDEMDVLGYRGPRRARVEKTVAGQGKGTIWLHGASGACIRCLLDERVAVYSRGKRAYRKAEKIRCGDFLVRLVDGTATVDPVVAIRSLEESVSVVYLTLPAASLLSEEGLAVRPS
jgi:hypothetical protein